MKVSINTFFNKVKIITSPTVLKRLFDTMDEKTKANLIECLDECGGITACSSSLDALKKLIEKHQYLHIVTTTDSDCGNGIVYDNTIRYVNRINYYLARGDKNPELYTIDKF